MQIEQKKWTAGAGWQTVSGKTPAAAPQLVLVFGSRELITQKEHYREIKESYPDSNLVLCSTAGDIAGSEVSDNTITSTAILFEKSEIACYQIAIDKYADSFEAGKDLGKKLSGEKLKHTLVFSDGIKVNGTALVKGILSSLPDQVMVTGGLVGDGAAFKETVLGLNEPPSAGKIILIGLYGDAIKVSYGSLGGWDTFGSARIITKSKDNVLYELDGKPALDLYKEYLGEKAKDLPGSGLLFPLALDIDGNEIVRTVLAVNEIDKSMTFAGDMPEGVTAKLMKANFDRLVDGAEGAAKYTTETIAKGKAQLGLLISCVGRKLVLGERIDEEIEAVRNALGDDVPLTGFYSYGEVSPINPTSQDCQLHNQTMTITTFRE